MIMVNAITQTVYAFSKLNASRRNVMTSIEPEIKLVVLAVIVNALIFKIDIWVKIHAKGMHRKKRISSNGKLYT